MDSTGTAAPAVDSADGAAAALVAATSTVRGDLRALDATVCSISLIRTQKGQQH